MYILELELLHAILLDKSTNVIWSLQAINVLQQFLLGIQSYISQVLQNTDLIFWQPHWVLAAVKY